MMESISGRGIVLRRTRHLDNDLKVTLFLRDFGKISAISKNGQRLSSKLKSIQEPFVEADMQLFVPPHGAHGRLTSGCLIDSYEEIRLHLDAFQIACQCSEVVGILLPYRAPSPEVYDILRQSFQELKRSDSEFFSPSHTWIHFVVGLLKTLGHGNVAKEASDLLSDGSLERCNAFIDAELERILPWRLKSIGEVH